MAILVAVLMLGSSFPENCTSLKYSFHVKIFVNFFLFHLLTNVLLLSGSAGVVVQGRLVGYARVLWQVLSSGVALLGCEKENKMHLCWRPGPL